MNDKVIPLSIDSNTSIIKALQKMDQIKKKLLIVLDDQKFQSLLSIGDIQRAILKDIDLNASVKDILRTKRKIKLAHKNDSKDSIRQTMLEFKIEYMPVLSDENEIVDIIFWDDIIEQNEDIQEKVNIPVVIMAGGKGSRLKPLTNVIPKALIPLNEKPIIEEIIERFLKIGCNEFYISVNHKKEIIKQYLKEQNYSNLKFIHEDQPLGTAGSLALLKNKIKSSFFVSNCDIIIDQNYYDIYEYHKTNKNELTIVSALITYSIPYGTMETGNNGILKSMKEKPELTFQVNTGMYILEPHLIDEIPQNKFFHITHLIDNIKNRNGKIGVFPVSEKSWIDIGVWKTYQESLKFLENKANI